MAIMYFERFENGLGQTNILEPSLAVNFNTLSV